jgi:hypothetical protein
MASRLKSDSAVPRGGQGWVVQDGRGPPTHCIGPSGLLGRACRRVEDFDPRIVMAVRGAWAPGAASMARPLGPRQARSKLSHSSGGVTESLARSERRRRTTYTASLQSSFSSSSGLCFRSPLGLAPVVFVFPISGFLFFEQFALGKARCPRCSARFFVPRGKGVGFPAFRSLCGGCGLSLNDAAPSVAHRL